MQTRVYKLYGTTTGNNIASVAVGQNGRVTAIAFDIVGVANAAVTNALTYEVTLNTASSMVATNDTVTSLASCSMGTAIASSYMGAQKLIAGLSIAVQTGDRFVLNSGSLAGTGLPATQGAEVYIYVEQ